METVADRWKSVQDRVANACARGGRNPKDVRVVAVSKTVEIDRIQEAYRAGVRLFGENYVQEVLPKIEALKSETPDLKWHFIGSLQSNKAKQVVGKFDLIHSLDRKSLAEALDKEGKKTASPIRALVEINIGKEQTKSGCSIDNVKPLLEMISVQTQIEILGLMVFPPLTEDAEKSRHYFAQTCELAEKIRTWNLPRIQMNELSMGVTSDFEVAIEEGATLVRIGTAIFGTRTHP